MQYHFIRNTKDLRTMRKMCVTYRTMRKLHAEQIARSKGGRNYGK